MKISQWISLKVLPFVDPGLILSIAKWVVLFGFVAGLGFQLFKTATTRDNAISALAFWSFSGVALGMLLQAPTWSIMAWVNGFATVAALLVAIAATRS